MFRNSSLPSLAEQHSKGAEGLETGVMTKIQELSTELNNVNKEVCELLWYYFWCQTLSIYYFTSSIPKNVFVQFTARQHLACHI